MRPTRALIVEHVADICERFKRVDLDEVTSAEVEQLEAEIGSKLADFAEQLESEEDAQVRAETLGYGHGV